MIGLVVAPSPAPRVIGTLDTVIGSAPWPWSVGTLVGPAPAPLLAEMLDGFGLVVGPAPLPCSAGTLDDASLCFLLIL